MGRSFLSVKLAAVFGLVVAAAVTAQQRQVASEREALEAANVSGVIVKVERVDSDCDRDAKLRVHTARAMVRVERAGSPARS